jgi:hypothetical protein
MWKAAVGRGFSFCFGMVSIISISKIVHKIAGDKIASGTVHGTFGDLASLLLYL